MDTFLRDNYWHLLCHASELPKPGDFLKLRWLGQDVVVASDNGNFIIFDNVCPHRGARIFTDDFGNSPISCKYHGWSYHDGELFIPCRHKFDSNEVIDLSLTRLKLDWCGDFIFASSKPSQSLDQQLGDLYQRLASISLEINGRHAWNSYIYQCDWKLAIENALDSLHTPFVHKDSLNRLQLSDPVNTYSGTNSVAEFLISDKTTFTRLKSISRFFAGTERFEGYLSIYLFPFTMLTSTFGFSYSIQNFFPSEHPQQTHFYSRLLRGLLRPEIPSNLLNHFFDSSAIINKTVFEEDYTICNQIDFNHYSFHELKRLSSDEEKIIYFRKSLQKIEAQLKNMD